MRSEMRVRNDGYRFKDARGHMSPFEVAVLSIDDDGTTEKERKMDIEFRGKRYREPDAVELRA